MSRAEREGSSQVSDPKKVELASPEWYELATRILAEVARE